MKLMLNNTNLLKAERRKYETRGQAPSNGNATCTTSQKPIQVGNCERFRDVAPDLAEMAEAIRQGA